MIFEVFFGFKLRILCLFIKMLNQRGFDKQTYAYQSAPRPIRSVLCGRGSLPEKHQSSTKPPVKSCEALTRKQNVCKHNILLTQHCTLCWKIRGFFTLFPYSRTQSDIISVIYVSVVPWTLGRRDFNWHRVLGFISDAYYFH